MKQVKITISDELYKKLADEAMIIGISVPQFIKFTVIKEIHLKSNKSFSKDLQYLNKRVNDADLYM